MTTPLASPIAIRAAVPDDVAHLTDLIARSATALSRGFYSDAQAAAALAHVFGVDSQLVDDGTYLVATVAGALSGCGGWSRRAKLFGGDQLGEAGALLDPATAPAKIRAFFVHPDFARRGVGTAILDACEAAAAARGFTRCELLATLPGVPFYAARGYVAGAAERHRFDGVDVDFVPMAKALAG